MTDETRILRTVGIPIVVAIILLVALPKMCARAVLVTKARQEKAAARGEGLHIESSNKPVTYPAGLDVERLRTLIENDNRFAAPYSVRVSKLANGSANADEQRMAAMVVKHGYAEVGSDGVLVLTRDGLLHLDGLVDDGSAWTFPLARREFDSVMSIDGDAANASAKFTWHLRPNPVASELLASPKKHEGKADLVRAGDHWTLTVLDLDNDIN
jgi:hypothetical protein